MLNPLLLDIPERVDTARLSLRPPAPGDGALLFDAVLDALPELRRFIGSVPWVAAEQSVQASEIYCRNACANFIARKDLPFLIFERSTQQLLGCVGLHRPVWEVPKVEVGYWCRSSRTGHGFITEAVRAVVQLAEEQLAAVRVELITDEENRASRAVAERCGFTLEGILRNERRAPDGRLRHTCVYASTPTPR